jgi:restriction system protein
VLKTAGIRHTPDERHLNRARLAPGVSISTTSASTSSHCGPPLVAEREAAHDQRLFSGAIDVPTVSTVRFETGDGQRTGSVQAMPRRKKTSAFEDSIDLVALMPWWAGVALAVIFYVVLHHIAGQQVAPAQPGQVERVVVQTMLKTAASFGQHVLPLLCLAGAGASAWRRHERKTLVGNVVQSESADALNGMTWQQFEALVGEAFRLQGYTVLDTGGGGADGGVDLVLAKGNEKFLVQCKQWRAFKVGVDVVRELYGVMAARGAAGGFVVTSGRFTEEATAFASGRNVQLIDGPRLHDLIKKASAAMAGAGAPTRAQATPAAPSTAVPACPACAKPMVRRIAKRGLNAGGEFWGCTGYPSCRGTSKIA